MPKYVIEREIPNAGKLNAEQLKSISQTSCGVLSKMGSAIQWVQQGGFPANEVNEVMTIIDPTTAD